jgi:hypothetical protein
MAVSAGAFGLMGAEPRILQTIAESGRVKTRWVCPECGCWICGASSADNGLRRVRSGTLDDTSWLRPTAHFWTRSKQPWIMLPEGDEIFETQPAAYLRRSPPPARKDRAAPSSGFLSHIAAVDLGIAVIGQLSTAQLPLGDVLEPRSVQVITLNGTVRILGARYGNPSSESYERPAAYSASRSALNA